MVLRRPFTLLLNSSRAQRTYDAQKFTTDRAPDTHQTTCECIVCGTGRLAARLPCTSTHPRHPVAVVRPYGYHLPPYGCISCPSAARLAAAVPSYTAAMGMAFALLLAVLPALSSNSAASELQPLQELLDSRSSSSSTRHCHRGHHALPLVAPTRCTLSR